MKKQKLNPKQIVGICITSVAALLLIFMVTGLSPPFPERLSAASEFLRTAFFLPRFCWEFSLL